jgi:hypothetical protein
LRGINNIVIEKSDTRYEPLQEHEISCTDEEVIAFKVSPTSINERYPRGIRHTVNKASVLSVVWEVGRAIFENGIPGRFVCKIMFGCTGKGPQRAAGYRVSVHSYCSRGALYSQDSSELTVVALRSHRYYFPSVCSARAMCNNAFVARVAALVSGGAGAGASKSQGGTPWTVAGDEIK